LKKSNAQLKFEKSTVTLNEILSFQKSPFIKTGLGYDENHNALEENPNSYANTLKGSVNNEATIEKEIMTNINLILLTKIKRMSLEELFH
jgi:hypothetical protein